MCFSSGVAVAGLHDSERYPFRNIIIVGTKMIRSESKLHAYFTPLTQPIPHLYRCQGNACTLASIIYYKVPLNDTCLHAAVTIPLN